ncbi:RagB/SusD family nutrient uptake outer membrane protein [Fulvivirga sp. 29W222]|uniref:RagB/SusD family nutrient uptake outer membrane protein n=1 Tax=Fulvivirga marina TaxID=2494733 RepID=A0A937KDL6_9BACT|nr:RagB/SusD family nutrient uptake outer membrane protein [Fulvivirga marina]MBL6449266.1 RagB/SusD family nutrient uptake outer membrane protein [Fulvivirga marina]
MKNIISILGLLTMILTSCSDFLEEENKSSVTAEDFYITAEGFESLVNANYSQLREIYGGEAYIFCSGTDLYAEGRNAEPPGLSQYTQLTASSEGIAELYNSCYEAIQVANMALHYGELTEKTSTLDQRLAEIRYLRANAYFLLVQTYGGVSLVTEYISNPKLAFDRSSAEEVYDFIISELEEALKGVGAGTYDGRVTKRAVEHLLAKVHLTRGYEPFGASNDFSAAATYADNAIAGQGLTIPFLELWVPGNEMNSEVIFSVQFDQASISADPYNLGNMQAGYFSSYQGGSESAGDAPYRTYTLCPTQFAISLFDEGDERWEGTFMTTVYERYYDFYDVEDHGSLTVTEYYGPKWASTLEDQAAYEAAHPEATFHPYGIYVPSVSRNFDYETIPVRKFDDPNALFGEGRVSSRDIILSRLADTYLIAAEAYLQSGDPATGLLRLNEVRNRAGVAEATLAEFDIDYILDERGRELLGEYHRWFDLKRTGKLVERASAHHYLIEESNFVGANGEMKILRPIPQEALDLNQNRDFPQNPAYQ